MSEDNEIKKFRRFFDNMEAGDLMKDFLGSMKGKPTPIKLKILITTLKNFDNLYQGQSNKVKKDIYHRMKGATDYLLSREEERKAKREGEVQHKAALRGLRHSDEKRLKAIKIAEMNKLVEEAQVAAQAEAAQAEAAQAEAAQAQAQAEAAQAQAEAAQAAVPSADHEQEEEKTGCGIPGCFMMGGNKSRKTRRIRKTKKYKKRKTRKNTKKRKTNQKRKTRGGKKNKRKKKQTRKR